MISFLALLGWRCGAMNVYVDVVIRLLPPPVYVAGICCSIRPTIYGNCSNVLATWFARLERRACSRCSLAVSFSVGCVPLHTDEQMRAYTQTHTHTQIETHKCSSITGARDRTKSTTHQVVLEPQLQFSFGRKDFPLVPVARIQSMHACMMRAFADGAIVGCNACILTNSGLSSKWPWTTDMQVLLLTTEKEQQQTNKLWMA